MASPTPIRLFGRRPFTLDRVVRMILVLVLIALAGWLIWYLHRVLLPFVVAWLIAYMVEPIVQFNKRWLHARRRFLPIMFTVLEILIVLGGLAWLLVPPVIEQSQRMARLVQYYANTHVEIPLVPESFHQFLREHIDFNDLSNKLNGEDIPTIMNTLRTILSGGIDMLLALLDWLLMFVYVIFIMLDYDKMQRGIKQMIPVRMRRQVNAVMHDVTYAMNHYFRGQALISVCVAIIFTTGFSIVGLPLAVVMGFTIGVINMVPYLQLITIVPTTILCLLSSAAGDTSFWTLWLECMAVYCINQACNDLILTPRIMGKFMGLNPAVILLSLSIWGALLGIIGLIIALPLTTLLYAYYTRYIVGTPHTAASAQQPSSAHLY